MRALAVDLRERAAVTQEDDTVSVGELARAMDVVWAALAALERDAPDHDPSDWVDLRDRDGPLDPLFSVRSRLFGRHDAEPTATIAARLRRIADEVESLEQRPSGETGPVEQLPGRDPT